MTSELKTIAIDLDDVLANSIENFIEFYNKKYNKNTSINDFTGFTLNESIGLDKDEETKLMKEYDNSKYFMNIRPKEGSQKAIKKLTSKFRIIVVTSRPRNKESQTKQWLRKYFPEIEETFFIRDNYEIISSKYDICKKEDAKIIIEDHPGYAKECADNGIKVILFDYPYNRNVKHELITRVKNWDDVLNIKEMN